MKLSISLSADHPFSKGDRVVCKIAKNEWYIGTVIRAGAKLKIDFDDGFDAIIEPEDFKHVKLMTKPKKLKRALTDIEAKMLYEVKKTLKEAIKKPKVEKKTEKKPLIPEKKPAKVTVEPPKKKPFVPPAPPKAIKPAVKPVVAPEPPKPVVKPTPAPTPAPAPTVAPKPIIVERKYKDNWTIQINAMTAKHWKYVVLDDPANPTFKFASSSMATSVKEALTRALLDMKGAEFTVELRTFAEPGISSQLHVLKNLTKENAQHKVDELLIALKPKPTPAPTPAPKPTPAPTAAPIHDPSPTIPFHKNPQWIVTLVPRDGKWSYAVKNSDVNPTFVRTSEFEYSNAVGAYHAAIKEFNPDTTVFKLKIAEEVVGNAIMRSAVADNLLRTSGLRFVETWMAKNGETEGPVRQLSLIPNENNAWKFAVQEYTSKFLEQSPFEFKTMLDAFEEGLLYISTSNFDLMIVEETYGAVYKYQVKTKQEFDNVTVPKARAIIENLMRTRFRGRTPPEELFDPNRKGKVISKALYESVGDAHEFEKAQAGNDESKLRYLTNVYHRANMAIFDGRLRIPKLRFFKEQQANSFRRRGHWHPSVREIAMGRRLFNATEIHVLNTFVHEMCHQAVTDIDRAIDPNGGHGPNWIRWMKLAGIPPERYDMTDQIEYMTDEERARTEMIRKERERAMQENHRTQLNPSNVPLGTPVQFYQPSDMRWVQGVAIGIFNTKFVLMSRLDGYHWSLPNQGRNMLYALDSSEMQEDFYSAQWQDAAEAFARRKGAIIDAKRRQRKQKKMGYNFF